MTLKDFYRTYSSEVDKCITTALLEDKTNKDMTTNLVLSRAERNKMFGAVLVCKEDCVISGIEIFKRVYKKIDPAVKFKSFFKDGDFVRNKQIVLVVKSSLKNLLSGERTALNFIQRMSGIASITHRFVKKLRFRGARILHTRKTTPNFRIFELAAVKTGGGDFHRFDLESAVLIKDNHIRSAVSVENILKLLKKKKNSPAIEIEVKTISELNAVIKNGKGLVKTVMLDNFKESKLSYAVNRLKKNGFKIEVSGGINLKNFNKIQKRGIDFYSIGSITHSYKSIDFSLEF